MTGFYIGVDPDKRGAVAVVNRSRQLILEPFGAKEVAWLYFHQAMERVLAMCDAADLGAYGGETRRTGLICRAALENPGPGWRGAPAGRKQVFSMGRMVAWLEAELHWRKIPFDTVGPQVWQAEFHPPQKLKGAARKRWFWRKAQELYPHAEIRQEHADAVLLAEWSMRTGGDR